MDIILYSPKPETKPLKLNVDQEHWMHPKFLNMEDKISIYYLLEYAYYISKYPSEIENLIRELGGWDYYIRIKMGSGLTQLQRQWVLNDIIREYTW